MFSKTILVPPACCWQLQSTSSHERQEPVLDPQLPCSIMSHSNAQNDNRRHFCHNCFQLLSWSLYICPQVVMFIHISASMSVFNELCSYISASKSVLSMTWHHSQSAGAGGRGWRWETALVFQPPSHHLRNVRENVSECFCENVSDNPRFPITWEIQAGDTYMGQVSGLIEFAWEICWPLLEFISLLGPIMPPIMPPWTLLCRRIKSLPENSPTLFSVAFGFRVSGPSGTSLKNKIYLVSI